MKRIAISVLATIIVLAFMAQMGWLEIMGIHRVSFYSAQKEVKENRTADTYNFITENDVSYRVKAEGDSFFIYTDGVWEKHFITGVNIGAGEPGIFPGELTISYETYYRWFEYISAMNCNSIRVYTTLRPQFYEAFRDFNMNSVKPLFLYQGVWMNEEDIQSLADVHTENKKILNDFKKDALDMVDIIHGKKTLPVRTGFASGTYTADVSKWFGGWIVGIEWDPKFVQNTNDINPDKNAFDGKYLYTQGATPFEAFLCEVGNDLIEYQTNNYKFQAPLSFSNWITTDPISHPGEPHYDEDSVTVNTENIKSRSAFKSNMFVTYHIYPYYPDCLNYQQDYLDYKDENGKMNTYRAYLKDLKLAHTLPIFVAEFGIPTSRGMGHESAMGYNQGHVDETQQGKMIIDMFESMYEEGYAGGMIFTWQDEWFKRTWNNVKFDIPDRRPFWSNIQTTEQCFGLLSFDPGANFSICYVDGEFEEWAGATPLVTSDDGELYVKHDERYMYFYAKLKDFNFGSDKLYIPINTIENQGNNFSSQYNLAFNKEADFLISVDGTENSRILTDSYYDCFYYQYGEQFKMLPEIPNIKTKNSGRFNEMNMCFGYELKVPTTGQIVPFKYFETGKLKFGNSNPLSDEYQSLADINFANGGVEIRIPWQLLNVMDPSEKKNMDDFYKQQFFTPIDYEKFDIGFGVMKNGEASKIIKVDGKFTYDNWTMPTYHERLKPAYYELQKYLEKYSTAAKK